MRRNTFCIIIFIFHRSCECRSNSHAPIGVMGEHGHKAGEMMQTMVDVGVVVNNLSLSNLYYDVQRALKESRNLRHAECQNAFIALICLNVYLYISKLDANAA